MKRTITNNLNVMQAWREGKNARNHKNTLIVSDGELYSCQVKIGQRSNAGACVVADYTANTGHFKSQTTSYHVNLAKRSADLVMHPLVWVNSPLFREGLPF